MCKAYDDILERIDARKAIPFLGAGSSMQCLRAGGKAGLSGDGLAREITEDLAKCGRKSITLPRNFRPSLIEAAEYYQSNHPGKRDALDSFVKSRLQGLMPTIGHYIATSFPWKAIVTTNYNTVAEDAWAEASNHNFGAREVLVIRTDSDIGQHAGDTTKIRLYKPHGCINLQSRPEHRMVLTSRDYLVSEHLRADMYKAIVSLANSSTTVFVGYSLADYTFRNIYYRLFMELGEWAQRCYSVAPIAPRQISAWKLKSMEEVNTTLINATYDVFMLKLARARGSLHGELTRRVLEDWRELKRRNQKWFGNLKQSDFI